MADETVKPSTRAIGPTITGVIDLRATGWRRDRGNVSAGGAAHCVHRGLRHGQYVARARRGGFLDNTFRGFRTMTSMSRPPRVWSIPRFTPSWATTVRPAASRSMTIYGIAHPDGIARLRWDKLQDLPCSTHKLRRSRSHQKHRRAGHSQSRLEAASGGADLVAQGYSAGHSQPCIRSAAARWATPAPPASSTTFGRVFSKQRLQRCA